MLKQCISGSVNVNNENENEIIQNIDSMDIGESAGPSNQAPLADGSKDNGSLEKLEKFDLRFRNCTLIIISRCFDGISW